MFDDLHDPDPPRPGLETLASVSSRAQRIRRRRSMTIAGSSLAVVALVAAGVVLRIGDDRRITTVDDTVVQDTIVSTPTTVVETVPATAETAPAATDTSVLVAPVSECTTRPRAPAYLIDGLPPGDATVTANPDGTTTASWGDGISMVVQGLGADAPSADSPDTVSRGDFTATIVPIGDGAVGEISIVIADAADGCERHYWVGPGVEPEQAIEYATQWIAYLDVERSLIVEETADRVCVLSEGAQVQCVDVPQTDVNHPLAGGNLGKVDSDVWTLQLLVSRGAAASPLSSLARRVALASNPDLELLLDVIPPEKSCGRVTADNGESIGWSIGASDGSSCEERPPGTLEPEFPFFAINGSGDAVLIGSLDETPTLLSDGPDPDDPPPIEGDVTTIDGVTLMPDGSAAIVGYCCEPIAGSLVGVDLVTGEQIFFGYGHFPAFTAGGMLVSEAVGTVSFRTSTAASSPSSSRWIRRKARSST